MNEEEGRELLHRLNCIDWHFKKLNMHGGPSSWPCNL